MDQRDTCKEATSRYIVRSEPAQTLSHFLSKYWSLESRFLERGDKAFPGSRPKSLTVHQGKIEYRIRSSSFMDSQTQGYLMALIFAGLGIFLMAITWHRSKKKRDV
jgi:hypothetical protein